MNLRESIEFLEANITLMKFNGDPSLEKTINALDKVVRYAKEQYCKQELADVMNGVKGGGANDGSGIN